MTQLKYKCLSLKLLITRGEHIRLLRDEMSQVTHWTSVLLELQRDVIPWLRASHINVSLPGLPRARG